MSTWAIVLIGIAGVLATLAAAVLGPMAAHRLQRLPPDEHRQSTLEAQARRMIQAHLDWARFQGISVAVTTGLRQQGIPTPPPRSHYFSPARPPPAPAWIPGRIPDRDLREKCIRHHQLHLQLRDLFMLRPGDEKDAQQLAEIAPQLDALEDEIVVRMDQLNYPEVDD